ncbi:thialysine N-epsilon-acetyltransferase isoform X2 [Hermetia illucens]|nr:thialysine N-epsilon-acetyltransferase isoform X2 [Hermetia illucens]
MSDGPKISVQDLIRDAGLDGGKEYMHCYVAESVGNDAESQSPRVIVGYSICFFSYSTWEGKSYFLEDIYVQPQYRKSGVGRLLFKYVAKKAREYNCPRLDFHVLDWNPARQFYEKLGATDLTSKEGWLFYRMNTTQMEELLKE